MVDAHLGGVAAGQPGKHEPVEELGILAGGEPRGRTDALVEAADARQSVTPCADVGTGTEGAARVMIEVASVRLDHEGLRVLLFRAVYADPAGDERDAGLAQRARH